MSGEPLIRMVIWRFATPIRYPRSVRRAADFFCRPALFPAAARHVDHSTQLDSIERDCTPRAAKQDGRAPNGQRFTNASALSAGLDSPFHAARHDAIRQ